MMSFMLAIDASTITCEQVKSMVGDNIVGVEFPKQVPFTDEVFNLHIDERMIASIILINKSVTEISCDTNNNATFNVYVVGSLFDADYGDEEINPIDFYNEKTASGEIQIKAIGFGRKIKLGFINLALKIASWFS